MQEGEIIHHLSGSSGHDVDNKDHTEFAAAYQTTKQSRSLREVVNALGLDGARKVFYEIYVNRGKSMEKMAEELAKDYRTINNWIRELGIKPRPNRAPSYLPRLVLENPMKRTKLDVVDGKPVKMSSIHLTDELSYLIGFAIGDGYIGVNNIELCNTEFGLIDPLISILNKIRIEHGGKIGMQYREFRTGRKTSREDAYSYRIWFSNSNIARLIKIGNKLRSDTVDLLLANKPGYFLAGFWDAEGTIWYSVGKRLFVIVKLCQNEINLDLIKRIGRSLDNLRIKTNCYLAHKKNELSYFYGNPCRAKENVYVLNVYKESVQDWIRLVGRNMLHPKKVGKIKQLERLMETESLSRSMKSFYSNNGITSATM